MIIKHEDLIIAYKKLKRLVYYDKTDLRLRKRLAEFEFDPLFDKKLLRISEVINSDDPLHEPLFENWLAQINFRIVPKYIENNGSNNCSSEDTKGNFISNVTSAKKYKITEVNYFFDGPIELHLIAVLWIMKEGYILDSQLGEECYGSRLEAALSLPNDNSAVLYRKYHELYIEWRDAGIKKAKQLLTDDQTSVCILSLDMKQFYYRIIVDYNSIARTVAKARNENNDHRSQFEAPSTLLNCLEAICLRYRKIINKLINFTHQIYSPKTGLPIGLCSSPLLANWHLRKFDKEIKSRVRPSYFGRYVDDIMLVVPASEDPLKNVDNPVASFMDNILVKSGILKENEQGDYKIEGYNELYLQHKKCLLQYFDAKHSIAGLVKFQQKLEENVSTFWLLPVDEADNSLEDVAYDLLYDGSTNKLRNVKGMIENKYELAKHLAKQTILHLLTDDPPNRQINISLRKFFKGKNAIEFHDLWERVLTFFLIAADTNAAKAFIKQLQTEIKRVKYKDEPHITDQLAKNLQTHLVLCTEMSNALSDSSVYSSEIDHNNTGHVFRYANLIRHHFVRLPLLNYMDYSGALTTRSVEDEVNPDNRKLKLSPRFVNFDECLMLANSGNIKLDGQSKFQWARDLYMTINRNELESIEWKIVKNNKEVPDVRI